KILVHEKGLLHRAFSLFVFNDDFSKMLLQRRALGKYHSGGLWSNACCGHFNSNDDVVNDVDVVKRRTFEELGVLFDDVKKFGVMHYCEDVGGGLCENEIDHLYYSVYKEGVDWNVNKSEVMDVKWIDVKDVLSSDFDFYCYTIWFKKAVLGGFLNCFVELDK
ncbi:MAG: isopentenyl-diphosphate delta-isomerase, partial [Pseudomonadota bacterium]